MKIRATLSMDDIHRNMLKAIARANNSDSSKMVRKWIREHWKEEYKEYLREAEK